MVAKEVERAFWDYDIWSHGRCGALALVEFMHIIDGSALSIDYHLLSYT
jgi:hypothetical protein